MKREYTTPEMLVSRMSSKSVICTSGDSGSTGDGESEENGVRCIHWKDGYEHKCNEINELGLCGHRGSHYILTEILNNDGKPSTTSLDSEEKGVNWEQKTSEISETTEPESSELSTEESTEIGTKQSEPESSVVEESYVEPSSVETYIEESSVSTPVESEPVQVEEVAVEAEAAAVDSYSDYVDTPADTHVTDTGNWGY